MGNLPTKQELLKQATKCFIFNKEIAKLMPNKTITRRVIPNKHLENADIDRENNNIFVPNENGGCDDIVDYAPYKVGNIVYVKEAYCIGTYEEDNSPYKEYWYIAQYSDSKDLFYMSDCDDRYSDPDKECKWIPASQMPKEMARYFYKVTAVRVEQLQSINYDDYFKEGLKLPTIDEYVNIYNKDKESIIKHNLGGTTNVWKVMFRHLWNSTAKKGINDWDSNPYVFIVECEEIKYEK